MYMSADIVVPAFNEETRIDRTLRSYRRGLPHAGVRFLVALDGCSDGTAAIVRSHADRDARVHLLELPKLGKGGVLTEAFRSCDANWVGFVDADGSTPPSEFLRLIEAARHVDGAIACRRHPAAFTPALRPSGRRFTSIGFAWAVRTLFRLPYLDTQCGAKVMSGDAVRHVLPLLSSSDFLFDVDLLVVAKKLGLQIREVPTVWIDRPGSKLDTTRDGLRMLRSLLRLWAHHRSLHIAPLDRGADCDRPRAALAGVGR
jgi:glycosyltransferase involved in cell wall biosynthesis